MLRVVLIPVLAAGLAAGCGGNGDGETAGPERGGGERSSIVVSTNILGDIVIHIVGDAADVEVIMPLGADPHEFAPSARQASAITEADLLVINGLEFEEGMTDIIDAARDEGVDVIEVAPGVDPLPLPDNQDDDPHFWTDPARMVAAVELLAGRLEETVGPVDPGFQDRVEIYAAQLQALDREIEQTLADIPAERRVLVTNHEVFGYFADRYGFEVVGAVIPGGTTLAEPSAEDLDELAELITERQVPAIFAESTENTNLADALAGEVGREVEVVTLYTESLGDAGTGAETYEDMMRTNARLIHDALV